jgi:hypothetical protein
VPFGVYLVDARGRHGAVGGRLPQLTVSAGSRTGSTRLPLRPPSVTSSIATVPHTQRRYRTHPCDVRWVDSTAASSLGQPHRPQRMAASPG